MIALRWAQTHSDGPSHAWPGDQSVALCGVERDGELVDAEDHRCPLCMIAHGTALADQADRQRMTSRWMD